MIKHSIATMMVTMTVVTAYWVPDKRAESTAVSSTKKASSTTKKTSTIKTAVATASSKKASSSAVSKKRSTVRSTKAPAVTFVSDTGSNNNNNNNSNKQLSSGSGSSNTGIVVGAIIAGIAVFIMAIAGFLVFRRVKNKQRQKARKPLKPDPFKMGFGSDQMPPVAHATSSSMSNTKYDNLVKPQAQQSKTTLATPEPTGSIGIYTVVATYTPALSDELEIDIGDKIELIVEYDDGWCQGVNVSKGGSKGVFPRHCIDDRSINSAAEKLKRGSSMMYK